MTPAITRRATAVGRNLRNVARLSIENAREDPRFFTLQIARKFASSRQLKVLRLLSDRFAHSARFGLLPLLLSEDREALARSIEARRGQWSHPTAAAKLADTAIAAQLWDLAGRILGHAPDSPRSSASRARLSHALGHLDEAIELLSTAPRSRQLRHYLSERDVLESWNPRLALGQRDWSLDGTPRILYVATNSLPFTASGYTQRTQSLLSALREDGMQAWAATRVGYPLSIGHFFAAERSQVGPVAYRHLLPARQQFTAAGKLQQQVDLLAELVEELRPTVLHTTTDFTNALAVRTVARAFGLPWVYEVRGQLADTWASTRPAASRESQRYLRFTAREAEVARSADAVLTLGQKMRENLVAAGVPAAKIQVIPNGVGSDYLGAPRDREAARIQLGLEPEAEYFGTVSSLVGYEGLDLLIRVLAQLAPQRPALRLLIVGDGVEREPLKRLAHELGVSGRCDFPGRVPRELAAAYHAALDVFAVPRNNLPVTRDVTPLKPVEAMASGVPVLASDLPALAELVEHGVSGLLVPAGDLAAWSGRLEQLLDDPAARTQMGLAGRSFVAENRTWAACSSKLKRIYSP